MGNVERRQDIFVNICSFYYWGISCLHAQVRRHELWLASPFLIVVQKCNSRDSIKGMPLRAPCLYRGSVCLSIQFLQPWFAILCVFLFEKSSADPNLSPDVLHSGSLAIRNSMISVAPAAFPKYFLRIKLIKVHLFFSDMAHEMQFQATLVFFSKIFCQTSQVCPCRKKKAIIPRHPTNTTWTKCKKMIGTFFRGSLSFCVYTSTSLQFVRLVLVVLRE